MNRPKIYQIQQPIAPVQRAARADAPLDTQAIYGECVEFLSAEDDYAQVRLLRDDYIGFIPADMLSTDIFESTHRVVVPRSLVYADTDFKKPPVSALTMGAEVRVAGDDGDYARLADGRMIFHDHIRPLEHKAMDFVAVAEQFLHAPYFWGGKSMLGIDCSGLVQTSLFMAGQTVPRDSGPQEKLLGETLPAKIAFEDMARGDLLFWPGHVAIARGHGTMIHATASFMQVVIEPIAKAAERIAQSGLQLSCIKRLSSL